jgi:cysteine desulfurase / selenocysteine lyase
MSDAAAAERVTKSFDVHALRARFPILARQIHGKPLVYLDSAASAQKPDAVIDAMADFQRTSYANVHRGLHTLANEATQAFEDARAKVAAFIGAGGADEIVFTKGATEAINLVAAGLAHSIRPGDEIVLSEMEHHANIVPWHMLRERHGAALRWAPILADGSLDHEALIGLIGPRTRMVALGHMSNVLGSVNDVARVAAAARAAAARAWSICPSTSPRSARTSTSSPVTSSSAPPASASCTDGPRRWPQCRPGKAAAR